MALAINLQVYRIERNVDSYGTWFVTDSYPFVLTTDEINAMYPVNVRGGQSIYGLPYLYGKIILSQPWLQQELFVLDTIATLQAKTVA